MIHLATVHLPPIKLKPKCSPGIPKFSKLAALIHCVPRTRAGGADRAAGGRQDLSWAEVYLSKSVVTNTILECYKSHPHSERQCCSTDSADRSCFISDCAGVNCKESPTEAITITNYGAENRAD